MKLKAKEIQQRIGLQHLNRPVETPVRKPELVLVETGGDVLMRVRVDVRIDSETDGSPAVQPTSQCAYDFDFLKGFNHKSPDPGLKRLAYFPVRLADTGKENLFRIVAATDRELYLIPADAVGSESLGTQDIVQTPVRIGLDGIMGMDSVTCGKFRDLVSRVLEKINVIIIERCGHLAE